jgi:glycosyltransferase involved in cell wall biosynthesis
MKPLAIIATHPIQYQAPLYEYLTRNGFPIRVFFLSDQGVLERHDPGFGHALAWDVPLLDGYPHDFLVNLRRSERTNRFFSLINPGLITRLVPEQFSAVLVHGYRSLSMLTAGACANLRHLPLLYRSETSEPASPNVRRLVGPFFRTVIDACLSIGSLNDMFYDSLGVSTQRRFLVPYVVDNGRFQQAAAAISQEHARRRLGIPLDRRVVLYAGKLVPWKQPDLLLRAFAAATPSDAHLVFAGAGQMGAELQRWAAAHLPGRVTFAGFMNQSEIPLAYRSADLLVLPSLHEPWGLVVNEVMNFGVPALVSNRVGCGPDLVVPGQTGDIFDASDESSLRRRLHSLLEEPAELEAMGARARCHIDKWGFAQAAAGLAGALAAVGGA